MLSKGIGVLVVILVISISFTPVFALTELERATVSDPRIVNAFGASIGSLVDVNQQIQISSDIMNEQEKSQKFAYLVQIKDETELVVSFNWFVGELNPHQKLSPSLSWTPDKPGEFTAEIFVWEGFPINHKALTEYITLQIYVR